MTHEPACDFVLLHTASGSGSVFERMIYAAHLKNRRSYCFTRSGLWAALYVF